MITTIIFDAFGTLFEVSGLRIKTFYDRYNIEREPADDRDVLIAGAYNRKIYAEVPDGVQSISNLRELVYLLEFKSNTANFILK